MSLPRPPFTRRTAVGVIAVLALMAGCVGSPASVQRAAVSSLPSTPPARPAGTAPGPAVTVPPLSAADPSPVPADPPAVETSPVETPAVEAPAPTPDTAAEPPVPSVPSVPEAPVDTPAPAPALPEPTAPYDHVLGFHGSSRTVYLTFDDGPGPQTPAVLDVLDAAGVKATFCQVGDRVAEYPAAEQRLIADGHTLCNHSWDHQSHLGSADAAVIDSEIARAQDAFAAAGATSHWFRAPGGDFGTSDVLRRVAQSRGVIPLGWGIDSLDWTKPGVDAIVNTVLSQASPGAIVLLHDAGGTDRDQTIAALPRIIDGLHAAGYDLQPLPPGGI